MEVRNALFPLHLTSKILCTSPFSLNKLQPSIAGSIFTIFVAVAYIIFHLWGVNRDMNAETTKNLIGIIIDSYNRYSGFCAFCILVIASVTVQKKSVQMIQILESIDSIFHRKFDITVDNYVWRR